MTEHTPDTLRVVIVDDEELARRVLVELLAAHPDVEVVTECADGFEAVRAVSEHRPDLILLDIQMPKLDGFEVLELLGEDVPVIFVTAYDQHAIRAFDVHAVDYLLKPFDADRLSDALVRARERIGRSEALPIRDIVSSGRADASKLVQRILIRDRADVHIIPVDQVDYIEAQDDYVAVRAGGKSRLKEQTLTDVEQTLDPTCFVRIHRRFLLQVDRLARIETTATSSRIAVLTDGSPLADQPLGLSTTERSDRAVRAPGRGLSLRPMPARQTPLARSESCRPPPAHRSRSPPAKRPRRSPPG